VTRGGRDGLLADAIPDGAADRESRRPSTAADAAIAYAIERDWLIGGGNPPHSICLTESGRALVDRR
jgi:hypothetical protein